MRNFSLYVRTDVLLLTCKSSTQRAKSADLGSLVRTPQSKVLFRTYLVRLFDKKSDLGLHRHFYY